MTNNSLGFFNKNDITVFTRVFIREYFNILTINKKYYKIVIFNTFNSNININNILLEIIFIYRSPNSSL